MKYSKLRKAAKMEDWSFVDNNLNAEVANCVLYHAIEEDLFDRDDNVRDLVATILMISDAKLSTRQLSIIESRVLADEYRIVRFRLAIALYKRGVRARLVVTAVEEAERDPDVGEIAKAIRSG